METKDIITVALSSAAFCFAITSFILTFRQRSVEDRRGTRKALTDAVASLVQVNLATAQLNIDRPNSVDERVVALRRTYNSQRRFLANHIEFLSQQIPELVTDIDCVTAALGFESHGDYEKAEKFYLLAVQKAPNNSLKAMNMRGLARFYFVRGNADRGRKTYEQSLELELPDNDSMRQLRADTYLLWAKTEDDSGYREESKRVRKRAIAAANLIGQPKMKEHMLGQIKDALRFEKDSQAASP
jgi:tetratricopeptide (TPR) repeat protein